MEDYFIVFMEMDDYSIICWHYLPGFIEVYEFSPIILFVRGENHLYLHVVFVEPWFIVHGISS